MPITILDRLEEYTKQDPNAPILFDETHTKGITYAQLDEMSGRVYSWLKGQGIGKEDFVLINLPRGVIPIIAMIGIWKSGAAWALVEDTYAPERIDFIRRDCGCKAELNGKNWDVVSCTPYLAGHEPSDDHDAAFAVYTSGTTGNPKGVLHERGNLQRAIDSISFNGENPFNENDRIATLSPLNFVATVIVILAALNVFKGRNYIASYSTIKNTVALAKLFITKRITITFLTPSYVRMLGNKIPPFLRMMFVGSEPANNISLNGVELVNIYACSESGFAVGFFKIDRAYDTCPIGQPQVNTDIRLLGEDGKEVGEGEIGELCFEDPFVRGYINLPKENEKSFQNNYFHSGDLARKDENGDYVLLGRSGDMIKINGNRIEPAEIEAAVKEALGISWAAVRGFNDPDKSFLCAYYKEDISFDPSILRTQLQKRLPYYMIPAYFMKVDSIPLKASGKLDRNALPVPDASDFQTNYVAAETENQAILCQAYAKVLHLSRVGIKDDFYELGGDSLKAIELISESGLPGLSSAELFQGRTPEKVAELYEKALEEGGGMAPGERNEKALALAHPLTAEQLYMVDYQLYTPASTMYNLFSMMKMNKELFSMEDTAKALKLAISQHPALLTIFFWDENGALMQKYTPEILEDIHVEHLTEFEFQFVKDTLVYPFKIIGGRMYRCRVFETEKAGYVFFDVHHSLFDGTSLKVLMGSIGNALMGQPQDPDYYYLMLDKRESLSKTAFYEESRRYFEKRYNDIEWSGYPAIDHESRDNEMGELFANLGIDQGVMATMERVYRISRNEFFITVAAMSIALYNKTEDIKISWIYNGREDLQLMSSVGLLFRDLPVGIRFKKDATLRDIFADVQDQVRGGIEHSCYPYVDTRNQVGTAESAYLLYQQDIRDMGGMESFDIELVDVRQNQAASQTILDMEILDGADGLQLMIDFAASRYEENSIIKFTYIYVAVAHALLSHNDQGDVTVGEIYRQVGHVLKKIHPEEREQAGTDIGGLMTKKFAENPVISGEGFSGVVFELKGLVSNLIRRKH